jgi:non-heme chloroperoxidase
MKHHDQDKHMKTSTSTNTTPVSTDKDLNEQANPGHGIPSQDPNPDAQMPLVTEEAEREAQSVLMGGGVVAGMATGAAAGLAVAGGPVGVVVGASLGAVAGALGSAAAGAAMSPDKESTPKVAALFRTPAR